MNTTRKTIIVVAAILAAAVATAQPNSRLRPDETVLLYADSFDGNTDPVFGQVISYAGYQMTEHNGLTGPETIHANGNIGRTSKLARIDLYFPKKANGQMVIICPGGGYEILSSYNEGLYVADWMLERGITVCVLKYRMPNGHWNVPLADVENAFRYCRSHAQAWGVAQIGIMGFSAGGHLAATSSNLLTEDFARPDFSILIYPVITMEVGLTHIGTHRSLITDEGRWWEWLMTRYSMEKQVSRNTPQTFLALCSDDTVVPAENSLRYYNELITKDVPAEMHIWPTGNHGWGFSTEKFVGKGNDAFAYGREELYNSLERWLEGLK